MAALCNRAGHYIFALWFLLLLLFSSPILSGRRVSRYCTDVAQRRSTKLCTMFDRLLDWYTIYTFSGALAPLRNFATCKIHFASKSCVILYWQRYFTALQQRPSAKLCCVVQGMELRNCCRGRHLYSAGRPSRWAFAHILVLFTPHRSTTYVNAAFC